MTVLDEVVDEGVAKVEEAGTEAQDEEALPGARTGTYLRAALAAILVALVVSAIVAVVAMTLRTAPAVDEDVPA